jgi:hypothetical protein
LATNSVNTHIFTLWDAKSIEKVKNGGVPVAVWDSDTMSEHQLLFKQWASGSYILIQQWRSAFVNRRRLNKGDEIGLYWDPTNSRFNFTNLKLQRNKGATDKETFKIQSKPTRCFTIPKPHHNSIQAVKDPPVMKGKGSVVGEVREREREERDVLC